MEDTYLFKLKKQQVKMVGARGYDIDHELWILDPQITVKKFIKTLKEQYGDYPTRKLMYGEYVHPEKPRPLFVSFISLNNSKKIKINEITPFFYKITEENKDGILVINSTLSPTASECNNIITEHEYQIFQEEDLLYDVTEHISVDKHTLLTPKEAEHLKETLGLTNKSLRLLQSNDPVCQYYNYPIGSIIKIESHTDLNLLSRTIINYRIVVKSS
jgi:DNA-directed RNA polymerase subunit H (RpoH/RPB5)